jgi:uncharacterized membrane protein YdjX (TVP38/TMEM64 family)
MSKAFFKAGNRKEKIIRWIMFLLTIAFVGYGNYLRYTHSEMTKAELGKWIVSNGGVWYFIGFMILMIFLWFQANKTGIRELMNQKK